MVIPLIEGDMRRKVKIAPFSYLQRGNVARKENYNGNEIGWYLPKTKLSGLNICPNGPERTESIVPGSRSTRTALGTYLPPKIKGKPSNRRASVREIS